MSQFERSRATATSLMCAVLLLLQTLSCVRSLPPHYASARRAAAQAQHERRFEAAARMWETAARRAPGPADRDEALYRAATAWRRASHDTRAASLLRQLAGREGSRQARAHLDLATLEFEQGRTEVGLRLLQDVLELFPSSGLGRPALQRALAHHVALGPEQAHAYLLRTLRRVEEPLLREALLYQRARLFEAQGHTQQAIAEYTRQIRKYPYPQGRNWEDASLRLAQLQRAEGQVREARATLEAMLEQRETAWFVGSYERGYAEARWMLAEMLEQDAKLPRQALREYRRLAEEHPRSRLRDDAWWAAARLSHQLGDERLACYYAKQLRREAPASRFTACTALLCPKLPASGQCREYIERALGAAIPGPR